MDRLIRTCMDNGAFCAVKMQSEDGRRQSPPSVAMKERHEALRQWRMHQKPVTSIRPSDIEIVHEFADGAATGMILPPT